MKLTVITTYELAGNESTNTALGDVRVYISRASSREARRIIDVLEHHNPHLSGVAYQVETSLE